jgi:CheY-like chemotaxis protein
MFMGGSKMRVLVVNNDEVKLKSLCDSLRDSGLIITTATNYKDAMVLMIKYKFDWIMMDNEN